MSPIVNPFWVMTFNQFAGVHDLCFRGVDVAFIGIVEWCDDTSAKVRSHLAVSTALSLQDMSYDIWTEKTKSKSVGFLTFPC